ncbi:tripartite tricarboxylate transporter substrate binding protein [Natronincola ferrireducens]|uniref:Tripartite-type tricarboxylate transporter, receptor component TctC n=1 Tax=Natronincola ferrireducens TaxID=393762 RepID=A0A1G9GER1_9FIRM|nr:tripartite tricarboxylate transporter substrate binding protein [Natronincola ferrireducens]SDK99091.1 Tripartite-type tricarboxylate transporter, receptor component TctC [Natronincola ferrireducens]
MKKALVLMLVCILMTVAFTGCAQETGTSEGQETSDYSKWPQKTIQIIAPYNPGGDTDFNARAYAQFLTEELGQPVVVSNVNGSGGVVGSRTVKEANPDGYTVLFMHPALLINELAGTADYGIEDFEYVATSGVVPGETITVHKNSGFKNLEDLIKYSQEHPGKINVSADMATMTHIMALQLQEAGANINIVSAGGASDRVAALLGGHIDVIINSYGTIADYLETGDFVALGQTNLERSKGFPDIAPAKEQGYDVYFEKYYFFAMPKGTPQEIINRFSEAVKNVSENPEYADMIFKSYRQTPLYKPAKEGLEDILRIKEDIQIFKEHFM